MCAKSAHAIVVLAQEVQGLADSVLIDEGSDDNEGAEDVPQPEGAGVEGVVDAAAGKLVADAVAQAVIPHKGSDAEGDYGEDKGHQAEVHGLLAIVTGGDGVGVNTGLGVEIEHVNAKGDDGKQNELDKTAVGFELLYGSIDVLFHVFLLKIIIWHTATKIILKKGNQVNTFVQIVIWLFIFRVQIPALHTKDRPACLFIYKKMYNTPGQTKY